ncbi:MAG: hypothetical protein HY811_00945 [Planctomycetes bacterium]|nr:hypothetical protein [Planctomycetota bacterium]
MNLSIRRFAGQNSKEKGQSVVLLLGFLVVLGLMMVVFWILNRVQGVSHSAYIDQFRAKFLAQAGIERALIEFQNNPYVYFINDNNTPWFYWGEDYNHNNQLDKEEDQNKNKQLDIIECPGELALAPSFASGKTQKIQGKTIGCSGIIPRLEGDVSDLYVLKIIDTSGQIYINGRGEGFLQLLNNLGKILDVDSELGDRIFAGREKLSNKSFSIKEELKEMLTEKEYRRIEPYITVWGQPNIKVIKPKPFSKRLGQPKHGENITGISRLNPGLLETEPRVPVNINTAPKPVLMAVLLGLNGSYIAQSGVVNPELSDEEGEPLDKFNYEAGEGLKIGVIKEAGIDYKLTSRLAELIMKERQVRPFFSWTDFNRFCDRLLEEGVFGSIESSEEYEIARAKADLIKASANPNTMLNDFNPNELVLRVIDKSDLNVYTTEFCFQPQGYFEIESTGIVIRSVANPIESAEKGEGDFNVTGLQKIRQVVKLFENHYETTQQDFSHGVISRSGKNEFTHHNKTLQLYPEPDIGDYQEQCVADGQIMRATTQNRSRNKERNELLTFRNHFDGTLKADYSAGNPSAVEGTGVSVFDNEEKSLFAAENATAGLLYPDGIYSELMSCPSYKAENNLVDAFIHRNLFGEKRFRGTVSFWVKPAYFAKSAKPQIIFSLSKSDETQNLFSLFLIPSNYQPRGWKGLRFSPGPQAIWMWDVDKRKGDKVAEYIFSNPLESNRGKGWIHIGIAWDTNPPPRIWSYNCPNCNGKGKIDWLSNVIICPRCKGEGRIRETKLTPSDITAFCINGRDIGKYIGTSQEKYPPYISEYIDFSRDNLIRLGERADAPFWNIPADATFDEIAIQIHRTVPDAKEFILGEFHEGRYYREEGVFTSGPVDIPGILVAAKEIGDTDENALKKDNPGFIKCRVDWTSYFPSDAEQASAPIGIQFFDERGSTISEIMSDPEKARFEIPWRQNPSESVKYKVIFRGLRGDVLSPLLTSPVFDDISITFIKSSPQICESYVLP